MGSVKFEIDEKALLEFVGEHDESIVRDATERIHDRASSMSAGFKSGIRHDPKTRQRQGGTPAKYDKKKTEPRRRTGPYAVPVGIVHTGNYAATLDNHQNNTLLKALG